MVIDIYVTKQARSVVLQTINISSQGRSMATKIITVNFSVDGTPQPGLSPVIDIWELDPSSPTTNTLVINNGSAVEIGQGWYRYSFITYDPSKAYAFTFDGGVSLDPCDRYQHGGNESYTEDIAPAVWNQLATDHVAVGTMGLSINQIGADAAAIRISQTAMTTLLNTLLKYERNRTRIDTANAQLIIYDDDCVTPLTTFNLRDFNGMPSVQEVCERIPTTC